MNVTRGIEQFYTVRHFTYLFHKASPTGFHSDPRSSCMLLQLSDTIPRLVLCWFERKSLPIFQTAEISALGYTRDYVPQKVQPILTRSPLRVSRIRGTPYNRCSVSPLAAAPLVPITVFTIPTIYVEQCAISIVTDNSDVFF